MSSIPTAFLNPPASRFAAVSVVLIGLATGCGSIDRVPTGPALNEQGSSSRAAGLIADSRFLAMSQASRPGENGDFYPLGLGSAWHYSRVFSVRVATTGVPDEYPYTVHSIVDRALIGTETLFGRSYVVEEERTTQDTRPNEIFRLWTRYREDRSGLYYADVCACDPPNLARATGDAPTIEALPSASETLPSSIDLGLRVRPEDRDAFERAIASHRTRLDLARRALALASGRLSDTAERPGGVGDNEVELLHYPIVPGASWTLRADFGLAWTVEGPELLTIPAGKFPAYRIRVTFDGMGPNDKVLIWYGRSGRLRYALHVRSVATDENGNPIGEVVSDESEVLQSLTVAR